MSRADSVRAGRARGLDRVLAAAIATVALVTGGLVLAPAGASPSTAEAARYLDVAARPAVAADRLPVGFPVDLHGVDGLDPSSSRFLGTYAPGVRYWLVADRGGNLCLVVADEVREMTAAGCGAASDLGEGPISVAHELAGRGGLDAFLVADDFATANVPSPWTRVGENLVVVPAGAAKGSALKLSDGDREIVIAPLSVER